MTHEPLSRDPVLGDALATLDERQEAVDWAALQRRISAHAATELTRRRSRRRLRIAVPAALAAGLALVAVLSRPADRPQVEAPPPEVVAATQPSIDELLDPSLTDSEVRAILSGATQANELLAIAGAERP